MSARALTRPASCALFLASLATGCSTARESGSTPSTNVATNHAGTPGSGDATAQPAAASTPAAAAPSTPSVVTSDGPLVATTPTATATATTGAATPTELSAADLDARPAAPFCMKSPAAPKSFAFVPGATPNSLIEPHYPNPAYTAGSQWLYQSGVFTLDVSTTENKLLPITTFAIDDLVVLIGANDTVTYTGGNASGDPITFVFPEHAIVLSDPAQPGGQIGDLADQNVPGLVPKTLVFGTTATVQIPGSASAPLRIGDLVSQGLPLKAYNELTLGDLKTAGDIDAANQLSFKLVYIPSGGGQISFQLQATPCP